MKNNPFPRRKATKQMLGIGGLSLLTAGKTTFAQTQTQEASTAIPPGPLRAEVLLGRVKQYTGGAPVRDGSKGKVTFEIAPLIDNGNTVPIQVMVASAMNANDFVKRIAVFNERNPAREVAEFTLSPANGKAIVGSRIRLATSQKVVAIAQMNDESYWATEVDVIVTLASCLED